MRDAISTSLSVVVLSFLGAGVRLEAQESLTGHWKAEFEKEEVTRDYFLAIVQEGSELKGSLISTRTRAYPFTSGSVDGKKVSIDIARRYKSKDVVFQIRGHIQESGQIRGTLDIDGELVATIRMSRAPDPAGTWKVKARSLDSDKVYESLLEIERTPEGYRARFTHEGKELDVRETGWAEGRMIFALVFPADDGEVPVVMAAEFVDENTLRGDWRVPETDRRSEWSATRVKPVAGEPAPEKVAKRAEEKKEAKARPVSFAGEWRSVALLDDDQKAKFTLKLAGEGAEVTGEIAGTTPGGVDFRSKLRNVKVETDGRRISFSWDMEHDGTPTRIEMEAEVATDGTLTGRWRAGDSQGRWEGQKVMRL